MTYVTWKNSFVFFEGLSLLTTYICSNMFITSPEIFKIHFLDIDLNDPDVEAAAAKIQSAFKNRKGFGKK